ncbi:MAG: hypothetical protein ACXVZL_09895, partial [Gaiellaceae bacterium]
MIALRRRGIARAVVSAAMASLAVLYVAPFVKAIQVRTPAAVPALHPLTVVRLKFPAFGTNAVPIAATHPTPSATTPTHTLRLLPPRRSVNL